MSLALMREIWIALAVVCIVWITIHVVRNARRLNAGVRAFKEEQEKQNGVVDPYAAMANLYTLEQKDPSKRTEKDLFS